MAVSTIMNQSAPVFAINDNGVYANYDKCYKKIISPSWVSRFVKLTFSNTFDYTVFSLVVHDPGYLNGDYPGYEKMIKFGCSYAYTYGWVSKVLVGGTDTNRKTKLCVIDQTSAELYIPSYGVMIDIWCIDSYTVSDLDNYLSNVEYVDSAPSTGYYKIIEI